MKKLIYLIVLAAFSTVNAQDSAYTSQDEVKKMDRKFIWSIGVEPTITLGTFNQYSGFGLGGSLQGEFKPGNRVGITLNAGYIDYFGKTYKNATYSDFQYIPVMAGVKLYLAPNMFYFHGQAGPGFGLNGLGTSFWYGGGLGINLGSALDVELKYTGWEQSIITNSSAYGAGTTPPYSGAPPASSPPSAPPSANPGYGGHYPTIGLRVGINF